MLGADVGDLAPAEGQRELDAADHTLEKSATENIESCCGLWYDGFFILWSSGKGRQGIAVKAKGLKA